MRLRSTRLLSASLLAASQFAAAFLALAVAGSAAAAPIHDQSDVGTSSINMTVYYHANDFTVAERTILTRATVWIMELGGVCSNGVPDSLNDALGWAIYTDAGGSPGTLVESGVAASRVVTDTGFDLFSCDVLQVRFELDPVPEIPAGTYWFALHDGAWGSGDDGSHVFWVFSANTVGAGSRFAESNTVDPPTTWGNILDPDQIDEAFTLEGSRTVWDQAPYVGTNGGFNITGFTMANDFVLAAPATVSALDAWIEDYDSGDDGVVSSFSGELGWALFDNGQSDLPGTRLDEGHATAAVVDTGIQSALGSDTARVRIALGRSITLEPGTYWLGLHENDWFAADDGSPIRWGATSTPTGLSAAYSEIGADSFNGGLADNAFRLWDDPQPLFSSGFEAGTACAWSTTGGICP